MPLTPQQADSVIEGVSRGKSLRSCLDSNSVSVGLWYDELDASTELKERYARARKMQSEHHAGKITDLAQQVLDGEVDPNAARVALDAMKWTAAKLHPAIYGDKMQAEVSVNGNLTVSWENAPKAN